MKLIDLLVKELPKRGGWHDGVDSIYQDHDGGIYAWPGSSCKPLFRTGIIADNCRPYGLDVSIENMVTRNQYKSVLALSQKPSWNGEGVPPAGAKCSIIINDRDFGECEILFVGESLLVWRQDSTYQEGSGYHRHMKFRPIRTEADRKRDAAVEKIKELLMFDYGDDQRINDATFIYDAIAAGKIPGVKLEG